MNSIPRTTKQSLTRERVLDLIEQVGVGQSIPSERQLSADLGVSRLTLRAAVDELVRSNRKAGEWRGTPSADDSSSPVTVGSIVWIPLAICTP